MRLRRPPPWAVPLLLWLLTCILWLPWLGNAPLRDWDEAGIARTALEFAQAADLNGLLPTRWGEPYVNKPPGLHLLVALAIRLGGTHEAVLRLLPAVLSTAAIPLVVLLQQELVLHARQSGGQHRAPVAGDGPATGLILMTTLPMARHGRLLMLDGALISATLLLWWSLLLLLRRPRCGGGLAGLACSALLLLKAPVVPPFLAIGLVAAWLAGQPGGGGGWWRFPIPPGHSGWLQACSYGLLAAAPGLAWHGWHFQQRGDAALVMWGHQGLARLVQVLDGHNQGWAVPAFELLKGSWPWLLLLPLGVQLAWRQRQQPSGRWRLSVLVACVGMVFSLKTQLPWYSHVLWPPLACVEGPALAWLWHERRASGLGLPLLLLGLVPLLAAALQVLAIVDGLPLVPLLSAGVAFGLSGVLLSARGTVRWALGLAMAGWWLALLYLWSTPAWLWELNENWPTRPAGLLVHTLPSEFPVFVEGASRPSLSWYGEQRIRPRPVQPPFPHHLVVPGKEPLMGCHLQALLPPSRFGQQKTVSLQWCEGEEPEGSH